VSRPLIVVGDKTDHGGEVVQGAATTDAAGKLIARVGDKVTCPRHGGIDGTTVIASGDPTLIIDGQPAARHGDKTACGATLLATQVVTTDDPGGGGSAAQQPTTGGVVAAVAKSLPCDEQFKITDKSGKALAGVKYKVRSESGKEVSGLTDAGGRTQRVVTEKPESLELYLV
jgi:uncharacterized Zn-binding protein involved in type VI secretion